MRIDLWGLAQWVCMAFLVVLAIIMVAVLSGCAAIAPPIGQTARDVGGDAVAVQTRIATVEAAVGDVAARVGTLETSQSQIGWINIASTGGSIGGYVLATALAIGGWMLWRRGRYWRRAATETVKAVDGHMETRDVKHTLAKAFARDSLFGRLVEGVTRRV